MNYCREIEAYLCRKNDGHLIRIVGPAFEQVCGWAAQGVPINVAFRGIDRYFERYYAKGPRRRPVRIEFCEADVLDVFDEWRRAVGVVAGAAGTGEAGEAGEAGRSAQRESLPAHLERVIARLTATRGGGAPGFDVAVADTIRQLDAMRAGSRGLRGDARAAALDRLRALDEGLIDSARHASSDVILQQLGGEADAELAPFRARLTEDVYVRARKACVDRLLRDRYRLPVIALE